MFFLWHSKAKSLHLQKQTVFLYLFLRLQQMEMFKCSDGNRFLKVGYNTGSVSCFATERGSSFVIFCHFSCGALSFWKWHRAAGQEDGIWWWILMFSRCLFFCTNMSPNHPAAQSLYTVIFTCIKTQWAAYITIWLSCCLNAQQSAAPVPFTSSFALNEEVNFTVSKLTVAANARWLIKRAILRQIYWQCVPATVNPCLPRWRWCCCKAFN